MGETKPRKNLHIPNLLISRGMLFYDIYFMNLMKVIHYSMKIVTSDDKPTSLKYSNEIEPYL
ncbi:hypothetical protein KHA80_22775 [Anaerobacillus sp. HL2]|nr:hypothetical protein KHA80_22775 [Anaerobacillus sp. HL2]